MTDIVKRLRAWPSMIEAGYNVPAAATVMHEAAAEIERLRERVATAEALATARRTALIAAEGELAEAVEVMRKCLNYIENTEAELGITLSSGDAARDFLRQAGGPQR